MNLYIVEIHATRALFNFALLCVCVYDSVDVCVLKFVHTYMTVRADVCLILDCVLLHGAVCGRVGRGLDWCVIVVLLVL